MTVTSVTGCGQQAGYEESYRGQDIEINLLKKVMLQIGVNDKFVEPTIKAIIMSPYRKNWRRKNICRNTGRTRSYPHRKSGGEVIA